MSSFSNRICLIRCLLEKLLYLGRRDTGTRLRVLHKPFVDPGWKTIKRMEFSYPGHNAALHICVEHR